MSNFKVSVEFEGFQEFSDLVDEMVKEFGHEDSQKTLRTAVRQAMRPVLQTAKILAPVDTGALVAGLQVEARKPTNKDRRSKYVSKTDFILGLVTTKAFPKSLKKRFAEATGKSYYKDKTAFKKYVKEQLSYYDARAIANEYGTANMSPKPFMRPALESQSQSVVDSLSNTLKKVLEKKRARTARRRKVV